MYLARHVLIKPKDYPLILAYSLSSVSGQCGVDRGQVFPVVFSMANPCQTFSCGSLC